MQDACNWWVHRLQGPVGAGTGVNMVLSSDQLKDMLTCLTVCPTVYHAGCMKFNLLLSVMQAPDQDANVQ